MLGEPTPAVFEIFTELCRKSLSTMLAAKVEEERAYTKVRVAVHTNFLNELRNVLCGAANQTSLFASQYIKPVKVLVKMSLTVLPAIKQLF